MSQVQIKKNGPLRIYGNISIIDIEGKEVSNHTGRTSFCRCGKSQMQPYCDGSHKENNDFE